MEAPAQSRFFKSDYELNSLTASEGSGSLTDLSLRSRPVTASTSVRDYTTDGRNSAEATTSGTDSGRNNDDGDVEMDGELEGSVSDDNSSGDSGAMAKPLTKANGSSNSGSSSRGSTSNASTNGEANGTSASDKTRAVANGRGQKLSRANMKKHDRQWALIILLNGHEATTDKPGDARSRRNERNASLEETSDSLDNPQKSSNGKKSRRKKKKKRRVSLPVVSSSLCRSFPLPGPDQIESYLKAYDSVDLNTRSNSPQNSSSPDNMSLG